MRLAALIYQSHFHEDVFRVGYQDTLLVESIESAVDLLAVAVSSHRHIGSRAQANTVGTETLAIKPIRLSGSKRHNGDGRYMDQFHMQLTMFVFFGVCVIGNNVGKGFGVLIIEKDHETRVTT